MTAFALTLVLVAAVLHATWNLCAKRAGGGLPFVWMVGAIICVGYVPVVAGYWAWQHPTLPAGAAWWILGSGGLKTSYALFLQRGYRTGDFSLIYPLARGTGPLLSTLAAVALLGERPSALAMGGGLVIVAAIFFLTSGASAAGRIILKPSPRRAPSTERRVKDNAPYLGAVFYGVMSGVFIAAYTLWDRHGVAALGVPPLLYDAGTAFTQLALLTPFALRRRDEVVTEWREKKHWAFAVALLSPIAYVLVLTALRSTPVSYVAPAREVSIVIGAFLGARVLQEPDGRRRGWAAVAMAAGVIALALG
ncbi:MAG: EamA family transporter [Opitutus sp.]|nr:EamA family transporter [Opitutus sp.]